MIGVHFCSEVGPNDYGLHLGEAGSQLNELEKVRACSKAKLLNRLAF